MAEITSDMVKQLRDATQAGMMDCKKALVETKGDFELAKDYLRKKGILKADKVSGRETGEGIIYSYIHHNNKLGVLLELDCVTDFVARTDEFKELAHKISLQLAAMGARFVSRDLVPQEKIEKEKEIYAEQVKESGKPAHIIEKIVESKLESFYKENCLLEQEYVFESGKTINDLIVELISKTGENIKVKKFVRWQVGESDS
ncbi:MAG TPA: translation elongation factor Ts [Mesotoga sp.]|jgi:elongation factor Ts|nr:translation elongation factor Ts [Mesotoga sp.]MDI9374209.1 translation elongation factor Ts [Thermotogota bacterium]NLX32806.1 translation elongation factor Ts [Thermotogaceae bacterium]MDD5743877.1 translation elongation factor Ts [Mesotoga sp.]HOY26069.1 translation elongation factor Ts [Mesotoga sp.]